MWTEWLTGELSKQTSISNVLQIAHCRWMCVSFPGLWARTLPAALEPSLSNQECLTYSNWWWQLPKSLMSFRRTPVCPQENMSWTLRTVLAFCSSRINECLRCCRVTWTSHLATCEITGIHLHKHRDDHTLVVCISTVTLPQVNIELPPSQGEVTSRHGVGLSILSFSFWNPHGSFNNQFYPHPLQMLPEPDLSHRDSGWPWQFSFPRLWTSAKGYPEITLEK